MSEKIFPAVLLAAAIAAATAAGAVSAHGDDIEYSDQGYGMGYGMQPDTMEDRCPGRGTIGDRGMMGHYGIGPGMTGGYGMMGGYGMGQGMMGGCGMGFGLMHDGPAFGLELNGEQRKQMARVDTELRKHNWALQGEIIDARGELFELYAEENPDAKKIGALFGKIFDIRRQMIEATIDAQNRQRAILTNGQREQLRNPYDGGRNGKYEREHGRTGRPYGRGMMGGY